MNKQKRAQLRRRKLREIRLLALRPKLGALMRIDGVVHECISSEGAGPWHYGGCWVPYETLHGCFCESETGQSS